MKEFLLKFLACAAVCPAILYCGASGVYAAEASPLFPVDSPLVQDGGPEPSSQPDTGESSLLEPPKEESGEPSSQPDAGESSLLEPPEEESGESSSQPDTGESSLPEPPEEESGESSSQPDTPEEESGEPPSQPDTGESNPQESPETKEEAETPPLPVQESGVCACEGCQATALAFALPFTECN